MEKLSALNSIEKLKGEDNWQTWKFDVSLQFTPANKGWDIINGTLKKPAAPNNPTAAQRLKYEDEKKIFEEADLVVRQVVGCTLKPDIKQYVLTCQTGKEMWEALHSIYEQKNERRLDLLYGKLFNYQKDSSDNVASHISKLMKIWQDLQDMLALDNVKLPESMLLSRILNTLPPEFLEFKNAWNRTAIRIMQMIQKLENLYLEFFSSIVAQL